VSDQKGRENVSKLFNHLCGCCFVCDVFVCF